MIWCVQKSNHCQNLVYAILEVGHSVIELDYVPFSDSQDLSNVPQDQPVLFHGAINFVRTAKSNHRPFAWFDFEKLCCHSYYAFWGKHLAASKYGFFPIAEIHRLKNWLFQTFGKNDDIFIRPDTNDKLFTGEVLSLRKFDDCWNWDHLKKEIPTALCVVATPTEFCAEWRLFVGNGKVVAGSQYKDGHALCLDRYYPQEVVDFAEHVCSSWTPHPFFVLDVGMTPDGLKIVECGSANCCGFYKSDLVAIVRSMSDIAQQEFNQTI